MLLLERSEIFLLRGKKRTFNPNALVLTTKSRKLSYSVEEYCPLRMAIRAQCQCDSCSYHDGVLRARSLVALWHFTWHDVMPLMISMRSSPTVQHTSVRLWASGQGQCRPEFSCPSVVHEASLLDAELCPCFWRFN